MQLVLVVLVARAFQLESPKFLWTLILAAGAYPVHALLPRSWRLPFFALVSIAAVGLAVGRSAPWVFGIGAVLIGVCHLPIRHRGRVFALLTVGAAFAMARGDWLPTPVPAVVWGVAGSLFMFRIVLYLQAIGQGEPTTPARTVAYFFMLPNAVFPLYPIVDYKTFASAYQQGADLVIAQRGIRWIVRGILHLLLYRFVYHNLVLDMADVASYGQLVQFMVTTFLLYLRVSGQFHLIVGVLHLFGFRLPETHHRYLLSSNFSDLWRRINIYWKDFMMKVVYYPSFFRLRRFGHHRAVLLSTALVFVATWALHAYQWFWLLGEALWSATDMLFWAILGALVVWQTWRDARQPRRPRVIAGWNARRALATTLTLVGLIVLWSLWSAETLSDWLGMWRFAGNAHPVHVAMTVGGLALFAAIAGRSWDARPLGAQLEPTPRQLLRGGAAQAALLALLLVAGQPAMQLWSGPVAGGLIGSLGDPRLNAKDAAELTRGYYESLTRGNRLASDVWRLGANEPPDWIALQETEAVVRREDFLLESLAPSVSLVFRGHSFSTNDFGMRDQPYTRAKPAGRYRIAVLGPSLAMGPGVPDGETFEARFEQRLNAPDRAPATRYEVLNFGVAGYGPTHMLYQLETSVLDFAPDLVLVVMNAADPMALAEHLRDVTTRGITIPYPEIAKILERAGVTATMGHGEVRRRLRAYEGELFDAVFRRMGALLDARGIPRAVVLLRQPTLPHDSMTVGRTAASAAGFEVIDLQSAYPSRFEAIYRLAQWDQHPNRLGHEAIAESLLREVVARAPAFKLDVDPLLQ